MVPLVPYGAIWCHIALISNDCCRISNYFLHFSNDLLHLAMTFLDSAMIHPPFSSEPIHIVVAQVYIHGILHELAGNVDLQMKSIDEQ